MNGDQLIDLVSQCDEVCFSGGAAGADRLFGLYANSVGHQAIHFSFAKHKHFVDSNDVLEIPQTILNDKEIITALTNANKVLGRSVPRTGIYVYNLLARNFFQIVCTERVYTIGELVSPTQLDGGTAWAVQMYMDLNTEREIYHYNMSDNTVYAYCMNLQEFVVVDSVPTPHGKWTGIGSRKATENHMNNFKTYFS